MEKENKFSILKYFKRHKIMVSAYLLLLVFELIVDSAALIYAANFLEMVTAGGFSEALFTLLELGLFVSFGTIFNHFKTILYTKIYNVLITEMSIDISYQALKISDKAYSDHGTGKFTQRISSDPATILSRMSTIVSMLQVIIKHTFVIFYIFLNDYRIGLLVILGSVVTGIISFVARKIFTKNLKECLERKEASASLLNEIVRSEKDIKSLNLEKKIKESVKQKFDSVAKQDVKTISVDRNFRTVGNFISLFVELGMLVLGLYLYNHALITLAVFMFVYSNRYVPRSFADNVSVLIKVLSELKLAKNRIQELYEDDEYELEHFGDKKLKNVKGCIEFKNVSFAYDVYKEKTIKEIKQEEKLNRKNKIKEKVKTRELVGKNKVIENMNFKIEPNSTVAFVGKSGSGKTTILQLVSKMYECDKGKVLIDDVDIKKLDKETIRSSIALVNQFPYVFDLTIRENILMAKPDATEAELEKVIKDSALNEFIDKLPNGLETKVGESGIKLSGGQKQRLAIARALLRKTAIMIFDESTSSLDNIAQNQVMQSIDQIKGKSTIIIVAHRLSTIKNVDKIFFLDGGTIQDEGTFDELFKRNKDFKTIFLAENIE